MSFQLLRTNPLLTTNFKVNIDTGMNLYLESIKSNSELKSSRYTHFSINKNSFLEDTLPNFYDGLPKEDAFYVRNEDDSDTVYDEYDQQFDDIYYSGSDYISDKSYDEEFEYFAPLFVRKNNLPSGFVILRVDDPSVYDERDGIYELGSINENNFRSEVIDKWKSVAYYDMTTNSDLGYWMDRNINQNERFPINSFELDTKRVSFSRWYGMDYETGVYAQKPMYIDKILSLDQPHFRMEKKITEGFKDNSLIYPHIFNFNFLFDDTPATPDRLRKYSLNRYFGFYVDELQFVTNLTSYITPELRTDTTLINNIIVTGATGLTWDECEKEFDKVIPSVNPFLSVKWDDDENYFIYVKDDLYEVERFKDPETDIWIYRLISEEILDDYWDVSKVYNKTVDIKYDGDESFSYLLPRDNDFIIDPYIECVSGETRDLYNDLYLIKINDRFHVLKGDIDITIRDSKYLSYNDLSYTSYGYKYHIQSDWAINSDKSGLEYWIGGNNSQYYQEYDIERSNRSPLVYSIYKIKFSNIKDFDFDRVDTKYSNFDYEKTKYYETDEEKLHVKDHKSKVYPKEVRRYDYGTELQDKIMNISSEYIASEELYELRQNNNISDIWKKNQSICKWGFIGSVSQSDYPYKLNNSKNVGNFYNRDVDLFSTVPKIYNKNLDYFYRVGNLLKNSGDTSNEIPVYYLNQTTNIQTEYINKKTNEKDAEGLNGGDSFNIATYFEKNVPSNFDFDYFEYFFSNHMDIMKNNVFYKSRFKKYATFYSDENILPVTVFKGLKIKLNEVSDIKRRGDGKISKILTHNTGKYDDYKISIILSDVYWVESTPRGEKYRVNALNNYEGIINTTENGIHVIVNENYKNILIIINVSLVNIDNRTFNNIDYCGNEKSGLYYGDKMGFDNYDPSLITAANFVSAINDLNEKHGFDNYVNYYHIYKDDDGITQYKDSLINGTNKPIVPPIILKIDRPNSINVKRESYKIELIEGPRSTPLYAKSSYGQIINRRDEYLSRKLIKNDDENKYDKIYRYSGSYEPIFNDINLFNEGVFCIIDPDFISETNTDTQEKDATNGLNLREIVTNDPKTLGSEPPEPITNVWKYWNSFENICTENDTDIYVYISADKNMSTEGDTYYLVLNYFDFNIPLQNGIINGIEVDIERKSNHNDNDSYVIDSEIRLQKNKFSYSDNRAYTGSTNKWGTDFEVVSYGSSTDLWGSYWSPQNINSSDFGVVIKTTIKNDVPTNRILSNIKCVKVKVYYEYDINYISGITSYFDRNIKFDKSIYNFGKINEIIYSKVNIDGENILKFKNPIYPIVDQFGYSYSDRFIFKSDWDKNFYYNTINSFEDDSTNYFIPPTNIIQSSIAFEEPSAER